jgi:hypothetical protein
MRWILLVLGTVFASIPVVVAAQGPVPLSADQKGYIAYDQCMMHAAIRASHTDAKDEEIYGMAKAQCATTRAAVIVGQETNREFLAALDAADADKASRFPAWIKGVRERRQRFDMQTANPPPTPQ